MNPITVFKRATAQSESEPAALHGGPIESVVQDREERQVVGDSKSTALVRLLCCEPSRSDLVDGLVGVFVADALAKNCSLTAMAVTVENQPIVVRSLLPATLRSADLVITLNRRWFLTLMQVPIAGALQAEVRVRAAIQDALPDEPVWTAVAALEREMDSDDLIDSLGEALRLSLQAPGGKVEVAASRGQVVGEIAKDLAHGPGGMDRLRA